MKKLVVLLALSTLLFGCSASGPMYEPLQSADNNAVLYIYRLPKFFRSAAYPWVYLDGVEQAPLKNGGYLAFEIPPGKHVLSVKGKSLDQWDFADQKISLIASPNQEYFVKINIDSSVGLIGGETEENESTASLWQGSIWQAVLGAGLEPVEKETGRQEISTLNLSR